MKLLAQHVALLTPLERKVYAPLIGNINAGEQRKQYFIANSHNYIEGDEDKLPFPERSKRGVMLFTLSQQLGLPLSLGAAFLKPKIPEYSDFIKKKLLALGTPRVYSLPPEQVKAAIHGKGKSPFWYYRNNEVLELKGIDELIPNTTQGHETIGENLLNENTADENAVDYETKDNNIICAINPPPNLVGETGEYEVISVLLKNTEGVEELKKTPLFTAAARLGLLQVNDIKHGRFWLTRE